MPAAPESVITRGAHVPAALRPTPTQAHAARPLASSRLVALLTSWHLLSLDAPTVAALWVVFLAHCAHIVLPWQDAAAMFTAVWILYAADRLLDARALAAGADASGLEARHRFHHRHQAWFYAGLAVAVPGLCALLRHANRPALRLDVILGALLFGWLLLIHARPGSWSRLPKELAVGVFFPAAVFIPSVARAPVLRLALLPDAVLFAAACSLNCLYIFAWEHPPSDDAHWSTRWAVQRLPQLSAATVAASVAVAALFATRPQNWQDPQAMLALPALACALSAALLLLLHHARLRLSPLTLRAAADACLLTPTLLLLVRS